MGFDLPELEIDRSSLRFLLGLLNLGRRLSFKTPLAVSDVLYVELVRMLVDGYRTSRGLG